MWPESVDYLSRRSNNSGGMLLHNLAVVYAFATSLTDVVQTLEETYTRERYDRPQHNLTNYE